MSNILRVIFTLAEVLFIAATLRLTLFLYDTKDVLTVFVIAAITGVVNFFAPSLTRATLWIAPIFSIAMIGAVAMVCMVFYWHHEPVLDTSIRQLFFVLLVLIPMTLTAKSAAWMTYYAINGRWVTYVPIIVSILAGVMMVFDTIAFRK